MFPFLKCSGGNCQDASILVEVPAVALKLSGVPVGTEGEMFLAFCLVLTYDQLDDRCIDDNNNALSKFLQHKKIDQVHAAICLVSN